MTCLIHNNHYKNYKYLDLIPYIVKNNDILNFIIKDAIDFTKYFETTSTPINSIKIKNVSLPEPTRKKKHHSQIGKGDEEAQFGKVAAGQKASNQTAHGINTKKGTKLTGILKKAKNPIKKKVQFVGIDVIRAFKQGDIPNTTNASKVEEKLTNFESKLRPEKKMSRLRESLERYRRELRHSGQII